MQKKIRACTRDGILPRLSSSLHGHGQQTLTNGSDVKSSTPSQFALSLACVAALSPQFAPRACVASDAPFQTVTTDGVLGRRAHAQRL